MMENPHLPIKVEVIDEEIKQEEVSYDLIEEENCLISGIREEDMLNNKSMGGVDIVEEGKAVEFTYIKVEGGGVIEENVSSNETNEDVQSEADGTMVHENEESKMVEFTYVKVEGGVWTESAGQEQDPLALCPAAQNKAETQSTEEEHTTTTDICPSTSQGSDMLFLSANSGTELSSLDRLQRPIKSSLLARKSTLNKNNSIKEKPLVKCTLCSYTALKPCIVARHMRVHTGEKPYKCTVCDYAASQLINFQNHFKTHTGEKLYRCTECSYMASQSSNLKRHMIVHTGKRNVDCPHKCTECDFSALQSSTLKEHIRVHTGEKPYKCSECDYSASQSGTLKEHIKMHTGEKPYNCTECSYSASKLARVKEHMRKHTGEKPYKCAVCEYSSSQSSNLRKHMKIHTG